MDQVRLAIPNGHLMDETLSAMSRAGYSISGSSRTYQPSINDHHIKLRVLRPQEIPIYVAEGIQDVGITGADWIAETGANVETLLDLDYSRVKIVVAVQNCMSEITSLSDLIEDFAKNGNILRISTEYPNLASRAVEKNPVYQDLFDTQKPVIITPWWRKGDNEKVAIYLSFGATEAKPPIAADAIIEVMDTGTSLRQNGLKVIDVLMESSALLVCNPLALSDLKKREKILDIMTLLGGVIDGRKRLHIFVNVEKRNLDTLLELLPGLKRPTISPLADEDWVALNTVIDRDDYLRFIPVLRNLAQGLVVYEPRQVLSLEDISVRGGATR
ncbi:MAG: ATP phosphoribosyltransferase [Candidatus Thorarchaeota archaeon]|nr:MAG: ATP phosphoribosyltransferase [Candidatus Thorarchaeota archaeon]